MHSCGKLDFTLAKQNKVSYGDIAIDMPPPWKVREPLPQSVSI